MKIYHAHGYVVRDVERIAGSQEWKRNSLFGEVFFEFEEAKEFLLKRFDELLLEICAGDVFPQQDKTLLVDRSKTLKEEYIADHIDYKLIVSEIDSGATDDPSLPRVDWYFRHDGAHLKRYFVYPDKTIEYRVGDELPEAGTKFKAGDLVSYCGSPTGYYEETVLLVYKTPNIPIDRTKPWENRYRLLHFDLAEYYYGAGHFRDDSLHENDMQPCTEAFLEELKEDGALEFLRPLQAMIREEEMTERFLNDLLNGKITFDLKNPTWREQPEFRKS